VVRQRMFRCVFARRRVTRAPRPAAHSVECGPTGPRTVTPECLRSIAWRASLAHTCTPRTLYCALSPLSHVSTESCESGGCMLTCTQRPLSPLGHHGNAGLRGARKTPRTRSTCCALAGVQPVLWGGLRHRTGKRVGLLPLPPPHPGARASQGSRRHTHAGGSVPGAPTGRTAQRISALSSAQPVDELLLLAGRVEPLGDEQLLELAHLELAQIARRHRVLGRRCAVLVVGVLGRHLP